MSAAEPGFLEILQRRAASDPDGEAFQLVDGDARVVLTWSGLARRAARLGEALAAGYCDGARIAICIENRPAWPVAYLATWYANGITVPVDAALEPHAIRRVLQHSGASVCLTTNALLAKVRAAAQELERPVRILNVDACGDRRWDGKLVDGEVALADAPAAADSWDDFVDEHGELAPDVWDPRPPTEPIGTIVYTSGTTGLPKGVMLSRAALLTNIAAGLERIEVTHRDHLLGVLPLFHVLPLMANCLGPIYCGAKVTYLADLNPDHIIAAFARFRITAFACVPLFYYRFHDRVMKGMAKLPPAKRRIGGALLRLNRFTRRRLGLNLGRRLFGAAHAPFGPDLRVFVTGAAKFDPRVYRDFIDLGFTLVQGYGLTEATAVLTAHRPDQIRGDTVGPPVVGVEVRIGRPNEDGVGEILARTPARMAGYYRNEEATAAVFDGEWLRTGDLGRLLPDGQVQITGRAKDIIVLASGKNIYPDELEAYYGRSELVEEMCILGIDDPARRGAERLHAVVVPDLDEMRRRIQVNVREMVKWELESLGLELPGPQRITSLELRNDPLPRTSTRKVKRFELKQEILERDAGAPERVSAPAADLVAESPLDDPDWAHDVRAIVARHARVEGVSRGQHLDLDLGLESLDRIELQAEVEESLAVKLPREAAGEVQTVGDLLDLLAGLVGAEARVQRTGEDRWARVLAEPAPDVEPYLRRRPVGQLILRGILGVVRPLVRLMGFRVQGLEHLPSEYPFIIAPNHLSYIDPFLVALALPRRVWDRVFFVGYSEYFEGRILGALSRLLRTVPIDQNKHLENAMQAAAEGLRRGRVLIIFPEGSRSSDGQVKSFRRGTGILARNLGIPVVPVGLWGMYEMWPREGRFRPHPTGIACGEPLRVAAGSGRFGEEEFMGDLRDRVIELTDVARALHARRKK